MTALDVLVVGAGVAGLTAAVRLAESGLRVEVWSSAAPERTTSAAAVAAWGLHGVNAVGRAAQWSRETFDELVRLLDEPAAGVRMVRGIEASRREAAFPEWMERLPGARPCRPEELPAGFTSGLHYSVPMVDMPTYLRYLLGRLAAAGGRLRLTTVASLGEAADVAGTVVNCTGIGAVRLADDAELLPIRGQLVITTNPGLHDFFGEDTGDSPELLYVYPLRDRVLLGGTAEVGRWQLEPDPGTARRILARCVAVFPELAGAAVLEHRVGLRPSRPKIRLEDELLPGGGRVVHNYGHGGAGVSLAWGCAGEVLAHLG